MAAKPIKKHNQGIVAAPIDRNQRRRIRTRQTILAAASEIFSKTGIDAATVNDITEKADVAYGSFYNHFKSLDEVVSAVAEESLQRVADKTGMILKNADQVELLPCVGARVILRTLWHDPAICWLLRRPHVLVEEFEKIAQPFMVEAERDAVKSGRFRPVGGHKCWLRVYPWLLIAELNDLLETGDILAHEDRFARISLRFLGVDDSQADGLIKLSRTLVSESGLDEPPRSRKKMGKRKVSG